MKDQKPKLLIDWATHKSMDYACKNWHYSKCIPRGKLVKLGVWEDEKFLGVVVFGLGATPNVFDRYNLKPGECCELVRIALRSHVHEVTKIISISIRKLTELCPKLKLIVSFADPEQGHKGTIYKAGNWKYDGKTEDCRFPIVDGKMIHPRQLSRIVKRTGQKRSDFKHIMQKGKHRFLYYLRPKHRDRCIQLPVENEGGLIPTRTLHD